MNLKQAREILGLAKKSNKEEVKKKYRDLAIKWHPDINYKKEAHEKMQEINRAFKMVMKDEFGVIDPWNDYDAWWRKQYGNDPLWGNVGAEEYGKSKKYAGIKKSYDRITNKNKSGSAKEFLNKCHTFALVGVSKNPKKYGNKVYRELKWAGYKVYPVNPRVKKIGDDKCYPSLKELPLVPDIVNLVVPPKVSEKVVIDAVGLGIKRIWLQPGSESQKIIQYCAARNVSILHNVCIIIESRKAAKKGTG
jgi:predicted CoA-binding protein